MTVKHSPDIATASVGGFGPRTDTTADALVRRLARFFDRIPHLAYVAVAKSTRWGASTLVIGVDGWHTMPRDAHVAAENHAEQQARRVARLLGMHSVTVADSTWGPPAWALVIYRRAGLPCWEHWRMRAEDCATRHSIPVPPYEAVCEWSPASGAASSPGAVATNARGIRRSSAGKANR